MKAIKCRLCGKNHWGLCDFSVMGAEGVIPAVVHVPELVVHKEDVVVHSKHGEYADLDKRKTYRREWMRERRLEERGVFE